MTDCNKYNPYPDTFSIRCPNCRKEATFSFPFIFLWGNADNTQRQIQEHALPGCKLDKWGGWTILVNFPDLFPWEPPASGGRRRDDMGACVCGYCGTRALHRLNWPQDAYFACDVRGHTLWAWTRGHAQALKSYIESGDRKTYPGYYLFLRHIPKVFLLAKNRETVSKKIQRMLSV